MVEKIHPTAIVVCGKVPDWLPKRHADIQIVHIKSFSEMWHEREKRKFIGRMILKGGYGGASGRARRLQDGYYKDSHGFKVTEHRSIIAAEYYLNLGMYVVFLHQDEIKHPDLLVDKHTNGQIETEHATSCRLRGWLSRKLWINGEIHVPE